MWQVRGIHCETWRSNARVIRGTELQEVLIMLKTHRCIALSTKVWLVRWLDDFIKGCSL
jgi:hypothetical protein